MPTNHNWIITTGSATWQAASFDTGLLPANGDSVFVDRGNADIELGVNQSAVTLLNLTHGPGFSGTFRGPLTAGYYPPFRIGVSGTHLNNSNSSNISLDYCTTAPTIYARGNASPQSDAIGSESFRFRNSTTNTLLYVNGDNTSVGVCTDYAGLSAVILNIKAEGGTLNIGGTAVNYTNFIQSGNSVATINQGVSSATLIQQSNSPTGQPTLTTTGATVGQIVTMVITGTAVIGHRTTGTTDSIVTLKLGPGASVDFSQNPAPCTLTNPVLMEIASTLTLFSPDQVKLVAASPTAFSYKTVLCDRNDVKVNSGGQVIATIIGY